MCIRDGPEPYGRTSTWACQKCKSNFTILVTFVSSNLVVLAFLYYSIHSTLKDNEEDIANTSTKVKASELTRVSLDWGYLLSHSQMQKSMMHMQRHPTINLPDLPCY